MIIARVVGTAIASIKLDALRASKILVVCPADTQGNTIGAAFLAVDLVGAGDGELVVVSQGSSARMAIGQNSSPADAAVIGILDSISYQGEVAFRKD
jgi:carbon dioxide concentrating mechanism protein CcmL